MFAFMFNDWLSVGFPESFNRTADHMTFRNQIIMAIGKVKYVHVIYIYVEFVDV